MIASIHMKNLDESEQLPTEVMEELSQKYKIPEDKQVNISFMSMGESFWDYSFGIQRLIFTAKYECGGSVVECLGGGGEEGKKALFFYPTTHVIQFPQTPTTHVIRKLRTPTTHRIQFS